MLDKATPPAKISRATWSGLFLSLFAMLLIRQTILYFAPILTTGSAIVKETLLWMSAAALLAIIRHGERLPFSSIGLGTSRWWKSILWGLVIAVVSGVVGGVLAALTGYGHGPGSAAFEKLPLWLIALIVLRAGVVEELFYRGYAIERLQAVGLTPPRSGRQHDRPWFGRLCCQRFAGPLFLISESKRPQRWPARPSWRQTS